MALDIFKDILYAVTATELYSIDSDGVSTLIGTVGFTGREYVSIANNVTIGAGEHDLNKISTSSLFYDNAYDVLTEKDCIIGNDVWIGVDSIIRRGVTIGNGAIIGANSFVNQDGWELCIYSSF